MRSAQALYGHAKKTVPVDPEQSDGCETENEDATRYYPLRTDTIIETASYKRDGKADKTKHNAYCC